MKILVMEIVYNVTLPSFDRVQLSSDKCRIKSSYKRAKAKCNSDSDIRQKQQLE